MKRWSIKFLLLSLLTVFLLLSIRSTFDINRPQPLAQDPDIQVYFNQNQARGANYTDPYRQIKRPGDNLENIIINAINSADSTIDVAVQEFRLPKLAQALAKQQQAGVRVRVILENTYNRAWSEFTPAKVKALDQRSGDQYENFLALADRNRDGKLSKQESNENDALVILQNADVPLIDDTEDGSKGSGLMHHKFVIIDGKILLVTSANFTLSDIHGDMTRPDTRGNTNNLLYLKNETIANIFTEEFEEMWGDGVGGQLDSKFGSKKASRPPQKIEIGKTEVTVHFSPNSQTIPWWNTSNGLIAHTLNRASQSVDLALFVFSEQKLSDILQNLHKIGVNIRALINAEFAFRNYSEGLDMLGVELSNRCKYEADNNPWQNPINAVGVPQLENGDKLHHKFGLIDRSTIITGSHNWSAAANYQNDETLLVLTNPVIAAHYQREFNRLYSNSALGIPESIQKKIDRQLEECFPVNSASSATDSATVSLINLNNASQEELETLPGIGAKIAAKIIAERETKVFSSLKDLQRVPGIGEKKLKKLEGKVTW